MFAIEALGRLLEYKDVHSVLDIGCGEQIHADIMREAGMDVTALSLTPPADLYGDYLDIDFDEKFDAIWASHVLEHSPNPGHFLAKCFEDLRDGGVLAVTVPPAKHEIVGGHVTLWNEGLLLVNLVLAGFDCSLARVGVYGYNISVIVRKRAAELPPLVMDCGDIERLAQFFPLAVEHGFDGRIGNVNWD